MEPPSVSVVVPVFNGEETIGACLQSLLNQTRPPHEVIVVDNGSTDRTIETIKGFSQEHQGLNLVLVSESVKGPAACRNRGVALSQSEIICFTDADCVPDSDWTRDVAEAFSVSDVGAVAGNLYGYKPSGVIQEFLSLYTLRGLADDRIFQQYTLTEGGFATANLSVRRKVFDEAGGFDQSMRYGEDHDLCVRIMEQGHKLRYVPNAVVYHIHRNSLKGFVRQSFFTGMAQADLLRKYHSGVLLMEMPGRTFRREPYARRIWVKGITADKKLIVLTALWIFISWGWLLPLLYCLYLVLSVANKARATGIRYVSMRPFIWTGLLIIKSILVTAGRWSGSLRYGVICL